MQKTVRINLQARKNVLKQVHKKRVKDAKTEWNQYHQQKLSTERTARQYVKEERAHRREDWILGPLAPNRNVGMNKGTYGTVDVEMIQSPAIPKQVQGGPRRPGYDVMEYEGKHKGIAFTGDTIVGNVVVDDRVVVVHGPERIRGIIGDVLSVDYQREELRITNVNVADIKIPPTAPQPPASAENPEPALYNTMEMPIPMSHVRLVGKITNDDGTTKDVIIRHVHAGAPYAQRALGSNLPAHTRYVTGSGKNNIDGKDIVIPWPADSIESVFKHCEPDTDRTVVEMPTWTPRLLNEPLGYSFEAGENAHVAGQPTAAYTLGLVENRQEADNPQRAGLAGFINPTKLDERRTRIARSIMDELRPKGKRATKFHDDTEYVKRKMLEDARSIWWRDRKVLSPLAEAAERALQERRKEREEQMGSEFGAAVQGLPVEHVAEETVPQQAKLSAETVELIKSMQAASLKAVYKRPDEKFRKRLARMVD